jgi:hypothetical protein
VTEPTVRLTGLQTGELHMINDIPLDRVDALEGDAEPAGGDLVPAVLGLS